MRSRVALPARLQRVALRPRPQRGHLREPARRMRREHGLHGGTVGRARKPGHRLDQRQKGLADAVMIQALAVRDPHLPRGRAASAKSLRERALADAGLAGHEHELALAGRAPARSAAERLHFDRAADQRRSGIGAARREHRTYRRPASPAPSGGSRAGVASRCSADGGHRRRATCRSSWMQEVSASSLTAQAVPDPVEQLLLGDQLLRRDRPAWRAPRRRAA